jgi:hypothetical protein
MHHHVQHFEAGVIQSNTAITTLVEYVFPTILAHKALSLIRAYSASSLRFLLPFRQKNPVWKVLLRQFLKNVNYLHPSHPQATPSYHTPIE